MDDEDVELYFAQYDVQTLVSDMLYELGFHRPEEVGPFLLGYVSRRFQLEGGANVGIRGGIASSAEDYHTVQVRAHDSSSEEEQLAAQLLLECRNLRRKYAQFKAEATTTAVADTADKVAAFSVITWAEFRMDLERMQHLFSSPLLWKFCERRLAALRGLFDAHRALNAEAEEQEALSLEHSARVDTCIQLARALPPGRLLALFRQKADTDQEEGDDEDNELIQSLLKDLGRIPGIKDLTIDADAPVPAMNTLPNLFSCTSNAANGKYLQEIARQSIQLLDSTSALNCGETYAEYRLPLLAEAGAWADLAKWYQDLDVESDRMNWVIHLPQLVFSSLKDNRTVMSFGELLSNIFGPLLKLAKGHHSIKAEDQENIEQLLARSVAIEVTSSEANVVPLGAEEDKDPADWTHTSSPPFVYQLYHVWTRLKSLNSCLVAAEPELKQLELRAGANAPDGLTCAYMLGAASVTKCASLASHAPLQYLFSLDEVGVAVSLCSERSLGGAGQAGHAALDKLFRAGVRVSLCTEDPSVSHQCDDCLGQEYGLARTLLGLSSADLAELARNSCATSSFEELHDPDPEDDEETQRPERQTSDGVRDGEDEGENEERKKRSIRERYRASRRQAELDWLSTLVPEKDKKSV